MNNRPIDPSARSLRRRTLLLFLAASLSLTFATPATGANLIVDSGYNQDGSPGSSSPFFLSSGTLSRDNGYICLQNSGVMHHSGGTLTLSGLLYLNYAGTSGTTGT